MKVVRVDTALVWDNGGEFGYRRCVTPAPMNSFKTDRDSPRNTPITRKLLRIFRVFREKKETTAVGGDLTIEQSTLSGMHSI